MSDKPIKPELRAPHPGEWFRVHPDADYRQEVMLARDDDGTLYLVTESMVPEVAKIAPERLEPSLLFLATNRANEIFLWPVRRPVPEQHPAYQAMDKWIRLLPMN